MGRAASPPQLLIAVWLYGYSRGVTSAREMEYEPGLMWLTGMEVINHHTLSDFRIKHAEALTELFRADVSAVVGSGTGEPAASAAR